MGRGDISDDDGNTAQPAGRTIRERYNGRRRVEEGHARLKVKVALFYADNGMVASTDLGWLQLEFDTLMGILDRVGLRINIHKTMGMV